MVTREDVIAAAREYLGTPYKRQGRIKGVGIDCIGLPIAVCRDLQLGNFDFVNYGGDPIGFRLVERIQEVCGPPKSTKDIGDLLIFMPRSDGLPQHCGIYAGRTPNPAELLPLSGVEGGATLIHAYDRVGRCAEHPYSQWWENRLVAIFNLPGVEDSARG